MIFNKTSKLEKEALNATSSINLIGQGTTIEGNVEANGDIRIDGHISGNIISKSKVVIGTTGSVNGSIHCQNADISGKLIGDVYISEILFLKATASLIGDIETSKFVVENGAVFKGNCTMRSTNSITPEIMKSDRQTKTGITEKKSA